ncbi:hypothetical protein ABZV67_42620 [Streptomyces sp. NPDC005065]|uniref:hypothetical protein n=1 Tax=Streptomyces sp. NPDC005065 TaxID=3154461 RepID=UPI0033AF05B9
MPLLPGAAASGRAARSHPLPAHGQGERTRADAARPGGSHAQRRQLPVLRRLPEHALPLAKPRELPALSHLALRLLARELAVLARLALRLLARELAELLLALLALLALRLLARELAVLARLALRLLARGLAELLLALLALLHQCQDRDRQRLLHGLLHSAAHALVQGVLQCDSQVRVGLVGQALLLQLLLNLLDLLQRLLHALRHLLARLLAGLLDRLLDHLRDLLLRPGHLLAELLLPLTLLALDSPGLLLPELRLCDRGLAERLLLVVRLLGLRLADLLGGVHGHAELLLELFGCTRRAADRKDPRGLACRHRAANHQPAKNTFRDIPPSGGAA